MPLANSFYLLNCRIDPVSWSQIDAYCQKALESITPHHLITLNGEHILAAQHNSQYRSIINGADLNIPDTTNVVWVSRLKGHKMPEVTPGVDLVYHLAELSQTTGAGLYLLGSRPGVAQEAAKKLQNQFPGIKISGTCSKNPEDLSSIEDIKQSGAKILLVAYGAPKHEFWIHQYKQATGAVILVGIGGALDMISGKLPRAPRWLRTLHLEWLWRLLLEPKRIKRIWNAVFVFPLYAFIKKNP